MVYVIQYSAVDGDFLLSLCFGCQIWPRLGIFFGMGGQWFCTRDSPCPSSPYSHLVYILGENDRFGDLWVHPCFLIHYSDSMGCSLPGSSIHGILQARMLEWVALSYSRGSFRSKIVIGPLGKPRLGDGFSQTNRCQSVLIIGFLPFFFFYSNREIWRLRSQQLC